MKQPLDQNLKKQIWTMIASVFAIILSIVAATFAWYVVNDKVDANILGITAGGVGNETVEDTGETFVLSCLPFAKLVDDNSDGVIDKWQIRSPLGLVDYSEGSAETGLDAPAYKNEYRLGLIYTDPDENARITSHTFNVEVTKSVSQITADGNDATDYTGYLQYALVSSDKKVCFSTLNEKDGVSTYAFTATAQDESNATNILKFNTTLSLYIWLDASAPESAQLNDYELNLHVDFVGQES